jgi:hypothetical protein
MVMKLEVLVVPVSNVDRATSAKPGSIDGV